jgi:hypothetical protein
MNAADLIRTIDDVEVPTIGRWMIHRHQPVTLRPTTGWRRRVIPAVASGTLVVADDPLESILSLAIETTDGLGIDLLGRLVEAGSLGAWRVDGAVSLGGAIGSFTCDVDYHGVFRHGERATAWLTVRAVLPTGPARRGLAFELEAELNAERV